MKLWIVTAKNSPLLVFHSKKEIFVVSLFIFFVWLVITAANSAYAMCCLRLSRSVTLDSKIIQDELGTETRSCCRLLVAGS